LETYLNVHIDCEDRVDLFEGIFKLIRSSDVDSCKLDLGKINSGLPDIYEELIDRYGDYLQSIDLLEKNGSELYIAYVCGSSGLEFMADLFTMFGPYVKKIWGDFDHDEDKEEGEEWNLSFESNEVCLNGNPINQESESIISKTEISDVLSLFYADKVLLINKVPPGDGPEWVREVWVGLTIPILQEELNKKLYSPPASEDNEDEFALREDESPWIEGRMAFEFVKAKSIDAYKWWKENRPSMFLDEDEGFVFEDNSWEIIDRPEDMLIPLLDEPEKPT